MPGCCTLLTKAVPGTWLPRSVFSFVDDHCALSSLRKLPNAKSADGCCKCIPDPFRPDVRTITRRMNAHRKLFEKL
jgi:hypothetical protein